MIKDVRLERVVNRIERLGEIPEPIEISPQRRRILPPIDVVRRAEPNEIGIDEVLLIAQVGLELETFVELLEQQAAMNLELPESAAVGEIQIGDRQLDEIRIVGPLQPRKQLPPLIGFQVRRNEPIEGRVFKTLHRVGKLAERLLAQPLA